MTSSGGVLSHTTQVVVFTDLLVQMMSRGGRFSARSREIL